MCGIAGVVYRSGAPLTGCVERMVAALRHRGPDDAGVKVLDGVTLGHARLSIIDLSGGHQPMSSWDGRYWITFNGEIYNYKELRNRLEKAGHRFATHSDTEVLIEHFRARGKEGLSDLNGMFAFAIWDRERSELWAARDRMGKKPFYFARLSDGGVVFSSEIKALTVSALIQAELDPRMVDAFLALGYVPPRHTIYRNVQVLPAAHALCYSNGEVQLHEYWRPVFVPRERGYGEAVEELATLLEDAVRLRLLASDVPVGAFLSGGLDSSTVVALAQKQMPKPIETFSIRVKGHVADETPYAQAVADREGTRHFPIEMDVPVAEVMLRMSDMYDEPFADASNIPTHFVSCHARQRVKVVLTGDGGDEMFGGYEDSYLPLLLSERMPSRGLAYRGVVWPDNLCRLLFGRSPLWRYRKAADEARRFPDILWRHAMRALRLSHETRRSALNAHVPSWKPALEECPSGAHGLNRAFWFDITHYLAGDILVKVDRAAMAVGLETRSPILDPRIVDFSLSLPVEFKIHGGVSKRIFRDAFKRLWPKDLLRRPKMGFGVPEPLWLERADVRTLFQDLLHDTRVAATGLLNMKWVERWVADYYTYHRTSPVNVWTILVLLIWLSRRRS